MNKTFIFLCSKGITRVILLFLLSSGCSYREWVAHDRTASFRIKKLSNHYPHVCKSKTSYQPPYPNSFIKQDVCFPRLYGGQRALFHQRLHLITISLSGLPQIHSLDPNTLISLHRLLFLITEISLSLKNTLLSSSPNYRKP